MSPAQAPLPPDVTWPNVRDHLPSYETVVRTIEGWGNGSARPFAGMPRPTETGYATRMRQAYDATIEDIETIKRNPDSRPAGMIIGKIIMQANGFASDITVGGASFDPDQGAAHIVAGMPAIVAGRYRQIRDLEDGHAGMQALANLNSKFAEELRPTHDELDMCRDHQMQVGERSPDNPVNPKLFNDATWKVLQKVRPGIAERVTKEKSGTLSMDPTTMEAQLLAFEKEIIEMGWAVQGKESCRIIWGMLHPDQRAVL